MIPQLVDASSLAALKACAKKYNLAYKQGYRPMGRSIHLHFGAAISSSMETYREAVFEHNASNKEAQLLGVRRLISEWQAHEVKEQGNKTLNQCIQAFTRYTYEFPAREDIYQPYEDIEKPWEFSFAIPLEDFPYHPSGEPFIFAGRFDLAVKDRSGLIAPLDEKTTASMSTNWPEQWSLRFQFLGYCWALNRLGFKSRSAVVRGICPLKHSTKFATAEPRYPKYLLDRFEHNLQFMLEELLTYHEREEASLPQPWPYNFSESCTAYGGCDFADICFLKSQKSFLDNNYSIKHWNPLSRIPPEEPVDWSVVEELMQKAKQND